MATKTQKEALLELYENFYHLGCTCEEDLMVVRQALCCERDVRGCLNFDFSEDFIKGRYVFFNKTYRYLAKESGNTITDDDASVDVYIVNADIAPLSEKALLVKKYLEYSNT